VLWSQNQFDTLQLHFKGLVIETFARLLGASAFLEAVRDGIPAVKEHR